MFIINVFTGIKPFKCADCNYCAYKLHNIHTHVNKTHGRKSILDDIIVDEDERERMMQLVKIDVEKMVERRNGTKEETVVDGQGLVEGCS